MTTSDQNRRSFIEMALVCVAAHLSTSCGGGSDGGEPLADSPSGGPVAGDPPPAPTPPSPGPSTPPSPPAPQPPPPPAQLPDPLPPRPAYAGPATALELFAATVPAGSAVEFAAPSLADSSETGSYPFDPPLAAAQASIGAVPMLDWATSMDFDPATRRYFVSGGRPRNLNEPLKLVIYDELVNRWSAVDRWSPVSASGHLYRATTVIPEHRLVAYLPSVGNIDGTRTIELWNIDGGRYYGSIPHVPSRFGGFSNGWLGAMFLCWFPTLGPKGSLIFANASRSRICRFDWATLQWLSLGNFDGEWENQHINGHYHPVLDKMIVGASTAEIQRRLAVIEPSGRIALTNSVCPVSMISGGTSGGPFFPHATKPLSIVFDRNSRHIWTYNWNTGVWTDREPIPAALQSYDTIGLPHPSAGGALFVKYGSSGRSKTYYWKPPEDWN
jgi:hypothetical protein